MPEREVTLRDAGVEFVTVRIVWRGKESEFVLGGCLTIFGVTTEMANITHVAII